MKLQNAKSRLSVFLAALLLAFESLAAIPAVTPQPQSTAQGNWWYERFLSSSAYLKENGAPTLLLGDSLTQYWEDEDKGLDLFKRYLKKKPYSSYVAGYAGDKTENILWRLENGELEGYQPKAAVLLAGGCNTMQREEKQEPPCDTVLGIKAIIDSIIRKSPETRIVLCALLPCGREGNDPRRGRNNLVNGALQELCDGEQIVWCEVANQLMTPEGYFGEDFSYDGFNLTTEGYNVWARSLSKILALIYKPDSTPALQRPISRLDERSWYERFFQIRKEAWALLATQPSLVIFGDDLAENWNSAGYSALTNVFGGRPVHNAGISRDAMPQLTWRAKYGSLHTFKAQNLLIQAGLMDADSSLEDYVAAYANLLSLAQSAQPTAKIYLMALPPRGREPDDPQRARIAAVNQEIAKLADGKAVFYVDCNDRLLDQAGRLTEAMSPDGVHYGSPAYEIWAKDLGGLILQ